MNFESTEKVGNNFLHTWEHWDRAPREDHPIQLNSPHMSYARTTRKIIGGLHGDISLCTDTNGVEFVLKRYFDSRHFRMEREVLLKCQGSPYIVQLHDVTLLEHQTNALALQYCPCGDIFGILIAAHDHNLMTEQLAKSIFKKIVLAVDELHQKHIVHRDIKPENIFVDSKFNLVLGDFGLASIQQEFKVDNTQLNDVCGTKGYMAPEIVTCETSEQRYNGYTSDMWSVACILFLILTSYMPLGEKGACRRDWYFNRILAGEWEKFWEQHEAYLPGALSAEAKAVLSMLFRVEPEHRMSAESVLALPWFKDQDMLSDIQDVECMSQITQLVVHA